ncbi:MAG TPA: nickel insertion protein [Burkholderiales bacterium]|nr:nickel insertion protein [Burkholderiales bacterium]
MSDLLLLVQIDDATGETLQHATQQMLAAGARNVQLLSSTTKKGRPGHVCLIDVPTEREDDIALILGTELGVWGYRVLEARHRHFDISVEARTATVTSHAVTLTRSVRCKIVRKSDQLLAVKAEHDDLVQLQQALAQHGAQAPLRKLRALIEAEVFKAKGTAEIGISLSNC